MIARRIARLIALFAIAVTLCAGTPTSPAVRSDFLYGATFFYERIPRDEWASSLARYRALGVNTIDLYVMWNWHELRDGDFDFSGRTNPRRDLKRLLALIASDGFSIVLRPGPVIRNEWRNGGYPAWLLRRPEYRMPLRDVLEGRYPAAATLQNAHSDAAAREWLHNRTHLRYAARWLQHVYAVVAPFRDRVLAVALDDDQGAYLDNDTWPAPNFHRYVEYLASVAHAGLGRAMPLFVNTYQMKVTASTPVWAWGNWYQSDAYSIGEHDRSQLEFSTGLLQTQPGQPPIMASEFQAGWLQGADEVQPRAADPTNTTLALHTLLQMGAHGIVNFPVQDTLNPAGWEAPWTNAFYAWDAAYSVQRTPQARYAPTARFGALMRRYGDDLVRTHPQTDAAIAYLTSAYDPSRIRTGDVAAIAQATIDAQRGCRIVRISCALVDLRYASLAQLHRWPVLIVPPTGLHQRFVTNVWRKLAAFREGGGRIVTSARFADIARPCAGGIANAALIASDDARSVFIDVVNYGRTPMRTRAARARAGGQWFDVPALTVAPRDALLLPLATIFANTDRAQSIPSIAEGAHETRLPLRPNAFVNARLRPVPAHAALGYEADVYGDGYPAIVLENSAVRLVVSPCAGARAFVFEDKRDGENLFTTVGGLRDAWSPEVPPSPRDYIAKYTHPIATGTFNRCYAVNQLQGGTAASVTLTYAAPDAPGGAATFRRSIRMRANEAAFDVTESALFANRSERAVQLSSVAIGAASPACVGSAQATFVAPGGKRSLRITWERPGSASVDRSANAALLRLETATRQYTVRYALTPIESRKRC